MPCRPHSSDVLRSFSRERNCELPHQFPEFDVCHLSRWDSVVAGAHDLEFGLDELLQWCHSLDQAGPQASATSSSSRAETGCASALLSRAQGVTEKCVKRVDRAQ